MTLTRHYTGHFKAVVTKPQNVMVMRDVACAGYVAGCNARWFAKDADPDGTGEFSLEHAKRNMQDRLSFSNEDNDRYASMLAFPAYEGQFEGGQLDTVMSVTTRLLPWEVSGNMDHNSFPGGQDVYKLYANQLNLFSVHYGEDMKAAENQDFISQGSTNNATCFIGPHRKYDPFTKSFMSLVPGQGHFGPDAIPGVNPHAFKPNTLFALLLNLSLLCGRMPAGAVASRSRSRPRATPWCRSSLRSTRRWRTRRRSRAIFPIPIPIPPPLNKSGE